MKKILAALLTAFGLVAGAHAQVFTGDLTAPNTIGNGAVAGECPLLSQSVNAQVSNGVQATWGCNQNLNVIIVGACSTQGSTRPNSVVCTYSGPSDPTAANMDSNDPNCPAVAVGAAAPTGATVNYTGRLGFTGSSVGGAIQRTPLEAGGNATTCTPAALRALPAFTNAGF